MIKIFPYIAKAFSSSCFVSFETYWLKEGNQSGVFLRIFTVAFLFFLAPVVPIF